jgi:hypothetical protein
MCQKLKHGFNFSCGCPLQIRHKANAQRPQRVFHFHPPASYTQFLCATKTSISLNILKGSKKIQLLIIRVHLFTEEQNAFCRR